jgi:cyclic pyranopterin phosphate synthase
LRLTADGKLRPCLFADDEVDVKTPLRTGCSQEDLKGLFEEAIARKPRQHHVKSQGKNVGHRPMSAIGG